MLHAKKLITKYKQRKPVLVKTSDKRISISESENEINRITSVKILVNMFGSEFFFVNAQM